jgi:hypothetical protein
MSSIGWRTVCVILLVLSATFLVPNQILLAQLKPVGGRTGVLQNQYEVVVRGVVIMCGNNGAGGCVQNLWGIIVKEILQSSSSCPTLSSNDTALVQVDHADIIGDVELMSYVEIYGACEPQPQNTKWPYLIYLDYPPHYIKVITGPGEQRYVKIIATVITAEKAVGGVFVQS